MRPAGDRRTTGPGANDAALFGEAAVGGQRRPRLVRGRDRRGGGAGGARRVGAARRRTRARRVRSRGSPPTRRSTLRTRRRSMPTRPRSRCSRASASRARCCPAWASGCCCTRARRSPGQRMGGAMRGAVIGACLLEGWAKDADAARAMAERGEIAFDPCHHHAAVGPMAGIISPSMPVWMLRNRDARQPLVQQPERGPRQGAALRRQQPGRARAPAVDGRDARAGARSAALAAGGPIELKPLIARALHMGDELHNRNVAASSLFVKRLVAGHPARRTCALRDAAAAIEFVNGNDFFFLNLAMAACKAHARRRARRAGLEHGHRHGAQRHRVRHPRERHRRPVVHRAGARRPTGSTSPATAAPTPGPTSATARSPRPPGLGGFAMAAAPAIVQFVGGTPQTAIAQHARDAEHHDRPQQRVHAADARLRRHAGGHRRPQGRGHRHPPGDQHRHRPQGAGVGQIGAGITHAPMACFTQALAALAAAREA